MTEDPFTRFVRESREEPGPRATIFLEKRVGDSGIRLRAKGGPKALDRLAKSLLGE